MANQSDPFAMEEFWDDLLAFIEEGRVVPIVGQELLAIEQNGKTVPLYRALLLPQHKHLTVLLRNFAKQKCQSSN